MSATSDKKAAANAFAAYCKQLDELPDDLAAFHEFTWRIHEEVTVLGDYLDAFRKRCLLTLTAIRTLRESERWPRLHGIYE